MKGNMVRSVESTLPVPKIDPQRLYLLKEDLEGKIDASPV